MKIPIRLAGAMALALFACAPMTAQTPLPQTRNAAGQFVPSVGVMPIDHTATELFTPANPGVVTCTGCGGSVPTLPAHVVVDSGAIKADTIIQATSADRGASVGTTAVTLMAANTNRRGFSIQNQSQSATCYFSGVATATADYHSFLLPPGAYFESPSTHVGTGAISIICDTANTPLYSREF